MSVYGVVSVYVDAHNLHGIQLCTDDIIDAYITDCGVANVNNFILKDESSN